MRLRKLELKDAPQMLEWMHDETVIEHLQANFVEKNEYDCERFIEKSWSDDENIHLAIVNDQDEYMGTVSLKHVNRETKRGEFAIVVSKKAMGKGYSSWGMQQMIHRGFTEYHLKMVYWCVGKENIRARKFYSKNGYKEIAAQKLYSIPGYSEEQIQEYIWFSVTKE